MRYAAAEGGSLVVGERVQHSALLSAATHSHSSQLCLEPVIGMVLGMPRAFCFEAFRLMAAVGQRSNDQDGGGSPTSVD